MVDMCVLYGRETVQKAISDSLFSCDQKDEPQAATGVADEKSQARHYVEKARSALALKDPGETQNAIDKLEKVLASQVRLEDSVIRLDSAWFDEVFEYYVLKAEAVGTFDANSTKWICLALQINEKAPSAARFLRLSTVYCSLGDMDSAESFAESSLSAAGTANRAAVSAALSALGRIGYMRFSRGEHEAWATSYSTIYRAALPLSATAADTCVTVTAFCFSQPMAKSLTSDRALFLLRKSVVHTVSLHRYGGAEVSLTPLGYAAAARVCRKLGKSADAFQYLEKERKFFAGRTEGENTWIALVSLQVELGRIHEGSKQSLQTVDALEKARKAAEGFLGRNDVLVAMIRRRLGAARGIRDLEGCEEELQTAYAINKKLRGEQHVETQKCKECLETMGLVPSAAKNDAVAEEEKAI